MSFQSSNDWGKEAEYQVQKHYLDRGFEVEDTSENPKFQSKDIDMIITDKDKDKDYSFSVEVKRDSNINITGNFFIEIYTNVETEKVGWFTKCEADFLYYINSKSNVAYVFKPDELRRVVKNHTTRFSRKKVKDRYKTILGFTIQVDSLKNLILNENGFWKEVQLEELTKEDIIFFIRREWN